MSSTFASVRLQVCTAFDGLRSFAYLCTVHSEPHLFANGPKAGDPDHNYSVEEHQAWLDKACGVIAELQEETGKDLSHVRA
eukprot:3517241-Pleurochrysis_carterae.AAC.1